MQKNEQVLKSYPVVADLYAEGKELYAIIYSKHSYELEPWLAKMDRFNIPELKTYINGIRYDIDAVKKGIELQYNNGLAESSVNKKSYKESDVW